LGTDNGKEDVSRQHRELATDHDRVAKVRHALNEANQEGVGQARLEQRQRDGQKGLQPVRAQCLRRLLQTRCHTLHHTAHDHEGNRREGKQLGNPDPQSTIKPACRRQVKGIFQ
jgi:hypothetical protein